MEHKDVVSRYHTLFYRLSSLPEKIVATHGKENLAEFVLYELAHPQCLNFTKAAFFINNPDFNCLQGIVGFSAPEHAGQAENVWEEEDRFSDRMKQSSFNSAVRAIRQQSITNDHAASEQVVAGLIAQLLFTNPSWRTFKVKHGNSGILLFETTPEHQDIAQQVTQAASLLAFCPIF